MNDTICAISTPLGKGAISIVRLSGKNSLDIMRKVFYSKNLDYKNIKTRYLYYGNLKFDDFLIEHCLCVYFKAPFSYTGEDMVEFQIHGGYYLTQKVLNLLIEKGARIAENGEFTKRSFENGKISLDMAESIIGEINAESESELKSSLILADGKLFQKINSLQNNLTECLAEIEATLDYPEEDFEVETKNKIFEKIDYVKNEVTILLNDSKYSNIINYGVNIAIIGAPNVGKSSTLNALVGQEKAIVTDIEGTTRDMLTESISYKGIKFNFIDTAGIRNSDNKVEKIGIEKAKNSIDKADVILFVLDGNKDLRDYDKYIIELLKTKQNVLFIINKSDLPRKLPNFDNEIEISALNNKNITQIKEKIFEMVNAEKINFEHTIITSARQIAILKDCLNICDEILNNQTESMDIISMLIKNLWNCLGKITGKCENEDIIDLIFSKFCLGK